MPPDCQHWRDCGVAHGGCCAIGVRSGSVSYGFCHHCEHREPGQPRPNLLPPATDAEADPGRDRGCGCSPEPEMYE